MKIFFKALLLFGLSLNCFSQSVINIATEDFPPHTSEKLEGFGIDCQIVTEAFKLEGIDVEYSFHPGARSYAMAKAGDIDGALPWVWRKEREEDFYFPEPVLAAGMDSFFHLKTYDLDWDPDDPDYNKVKGVLFGAIIGYNYGEDFTQAEESGLIKVHRVSTIKQNFQKLLTGRISIFISGDIVGYYELKNSIFSSREIEKVTHVFENNRPTENFYLILSKKRNNGQFFLDAFNRGLKKLKTSGRYDEIMGK